MKAIHIAQLTGPDDVQVVDVPEP
ncbi:MAG: hypothetical protein JWP18_141, partial [Solirubrobacterales bacterium]|nr:hypothetical protein [Solirubrobacterales bacterium]